MIVWAVVVAAGSGSRFGGAKQFERLGTRRVVDWAVAAARTAASGVVLVVPIGARGGDEPVDVVVSGGATRTESVRAGLAVVPAEAEVVVVHDAARPFATPELFQAVIAAVGKGADGAIPALTMADTMKRVRDGTVVDTVDRADLVAVQTPQAFAAAMLRRAYGQVGEATDDAALVEATGGRVVVVAGDPANLKLTSAGDLVRAEQWLASRSAL
ncbi:MAG: 2-C-methyl-D-erythritol 4-phosphate cytidylyltransferase [Acidimicrobiales bacterium]